MKPLGFGSIRLTSGDLLERARRSFTRLRREPYCPGEVFHPADYDWPGDFEGRLLLAQILLAQALGEEPANLATILDALPDHLNDRGYLGPVRADGLVDEQQISGHNWFLSALVALYRWRGVPDTLEAIRRVVVGLLLPTAGAYAAYPSDPEQRAAMPEGAAAGSRVDHRIGRWLPSSDVGCAFIALDGATAAFQLLPEGSDREALGQLIGEMIAAYRAIDVRALSFQTHATLSALRGVLRHYETTGDGALLEFAAGRYATYKGHGMTESYSNENWFGRPTWTEPCAVVDSFLVAMALWRHTGDEGYLDDAHHVYWNALGHGQRPNGGFGCDTCTLAGLEQGAFLAVHSPGVYEATWCCTMRGGAGLAEAIRQAAWQDAEGVALPFYHPGEYRARLSQGTLAWTVDSSYPYGGEVTLSFGEAPEAGAVALRLYVPSWTPRRSVSLVVNGEAAVVRIEQGLATIVRRWAPGDKVVMSYEVGLRCERLLRDTSRYPDLCTLRHGPLILGMENEDGPIELPPTPPRPLGEGRYCIPAGGFTLAPINQALYLSDEEALARRVQVLFRSQQPW